MLPTTVHMHWLMRHHGLSALAPSKQQHTAVNSSATSPDRLQAAAAAGVLLLHPASHHPCQAQRLHGCCCRP